MTTKSVGAPRIYGQGVYQDYPVIASDIIFEGSAVGENASGYSRPLVAGDVFQGFAVDGDADNSSGAAGDINVRVISQGIACNLPVTGATAVTANDFPPVYASDDNTFTLTVGTNTSIGNIIRWVSSGVCDVWFDVPRGPASVATADIVAEAVTLAKMADLAQGSIYSGQAANRPAALDLSGDAEFAIGDGTDVNAAAITGDVTIANTGVATIGADKVDLAMLNSGILPSHILVFGGTETTTGGSATEAHTVTGLVAATDFVLVTIIDYGTNTVTLLQSAVTNDTITNLFSGDPGNDLIFHYAVFRAAA